LLAYHEFDLRSKAVFLRKTGENLFDILVDKAAGEAFSYVFKTPYRETLARSIFPFSQWVQASSKGSPPRGIIGFACKQHFSSRLPWIIFKRVTPLLTRSHALPKHKHGFPSIEAAKPILSPLLFRDY
jgi:hypothetical protein